MSRPGLCAHALDCVQEYSKNVKEPVLQIHGANPEVVSSDRDVCCNPDLHNRLTAFIRRRIYVSGFY